MNFFELCRWAFCALAALIALRVTSQHGLAWYWIAVAVVTGFVLPIALISLIVYMNKTLRDLRPPRPICARGCCNWNDYQVVEFVAEGIVFVCKCGTRYSHAGTRFMILQSSGNHRPYMVRDARFRWKKAI